MIRLYIYTTHSAYSKKTARGYPGKQYMELSKEALREDEMQIKLRKHRFNLENELRGLGRRSLN